MRRSHRLTKLVAPLAAVALIMATPQAALAERPDVGPMPGPAAESDTGLWVVTLEDPALASYTGGLPGLAATSPQATGHEKLDVSSAESRAYLAHLAERQQLFTTRAQSVLGRDVEVAYEYRNVLNGVAVAADATEAARLASLPGVTGVFPDLVQEIETDTSHDLIGSAAIWDGNTSSGLATRGEGVVVGMLDTGINPHHPSFAEVDGTGYVHENPYGSGNFVGVCDPAHPAHEDICNDKLIGAWSFHPNAPSAQDWNNHGSHVGGTIAGNIHEATITVGEDTFTRTIQGVAPRANIISYLVCFPSCPQTSSVAAVDQAIADGVDVLNYSISGVDNPWVDIVDLAFLDAFEAGIFVAASAGNAGPFPGSVAKTGPWNAAVAASNNYRIFALTVDATGPAPVSPDLLDMPAAPGAGPAISEELDAEIRYAGLIDPGNSLGCDPFPADSLTGSLLLVQRGACTFATKVDHAADAGAVGVVIFNHLGGPPVVPGGLENTTIPAVMIDVERGSDLRDFIIDNDPTPTTARINPEAAVVTDEAWGTVMAGFSSRGPSQFEMLAPTFTAPGVNILAAGREVDGDPDRYAILQGTSMSSPHGAGAAALLIALHPDWSPAEVRSALASTADPHTLVKEDGVTEADPFDQGSGLINLAAAARVGLVMDETHANFVAANPAIGGDPKTLNIPAMVAHECDPTCTWTRTVTSVSERSTVYWASVDAPEGMTVTVSPPAFVIAPGASRQVTITVDASGLPAGEWAFADITLNPTRGAGSQAVSPVSYPIAITP
jgi:subtilisin family serine protease